ncbi:MAG: hypothetical protein ACFE94_18625 [Candidatus Hodarchaeota archaeon]
MSALGQRGQVDSFAFKNGSKTILSPTLICAKQYLEDTTSAMSLVPIVFAAFANIFSIFRGTLAISSSDTPMTFFNTFLAISSIIFTPF